MIKAVGFSLGDYGYICTGEQSDKNNTTITNFTNALWRYDPISDIWTSMPPLPGNSRVDAIAFTIDSNGDGVDDKAYVGLGKDQEGDCLKRYLMNTHQMEDGKKKLIFLLQILMQLLLPIEQFGYVATGLDSCMIFSENIYEFDPNDDGDGFNEAGNPLGRWKTKAPLPGPPRAGAVGFSIDNYGYIATGWTPSGVSRSLYRFDPNQLDSMGVAIGAWKELDAKLESAARRDASAFVIQQKAYVGLGNSSRTPNNTDPRFKDFYVFDSQSESWDQIADMDIDLNHHAASFSVNGIGYIYGGKSGSSVFFSPTAKLFIYTPSE